MNLKDKDQAMMMSSGVELSASEETADKNIWSQKAMTLLRAIGQYSCSAGISLGYTLLGFSLLMALWAVVAAATESFPGPLATLKVLCEMLMDPFYVYGPNDMGIGLQLWSSLLRVFGGFSLGAIFAIPMGMLMGANEFCKRTFYPIVQILKPVSPLAWFPIGLVAFQSASTATIFIIFITSLWPTLINTAFGVASIPDDHKNVAKAFGFSRWKYITKVVLPFSLPHIITGLRLSIGVAWLVIVAGEMLSGGTGIGFFVWDSWNSLNLENVIAAILIIGLVGLLLDKVFSFVEKRVSYGI